MFIENAKAHAREIELIVNDWYGKIWKAILIGVGTSCFLVLVMWIINIRFVKEWNLFFFLFGTIAVGFILFVPKLQAAALLVGIISKGLKDEDMSQGAREALLSWYRMIQSIIFWFWVVAGVLSTWSFSKEPGVFFMFLAMSAFIGFVTVYFKIKASILKWILLGYPVIIILICVWKTMPDEWKPNLDKNLPAPVGKSATNPNPEPRDKLRYATVTVPGDGRVTIPNQGRCRFSNLPKEFREAVTDTDTSNGAEILVTSTHPKVVQFTFLFFDAGDCKSEFRKLKAAGTIQ